MRSLAGGADHPDPLRHRELDGQKAHAARRAVQDQGFAPRDPDRTQRVDRGRAGQHQAGPLLEGERGRLGHHRRGRDDQALGVGPRGTEGDDLVTDMDRCPQALRRAVAPTASTTPDASSPSDIGNNDGSLPLAPP